MKPVTPATLSAAAEAVEIFERLGAMSYGCDVVGRATDYAERAGKQDRDKLRAGWAAIRDYIRAAHSRVQERAK